MKMLQTEMGDEEIGSYTSCLKSWSTGLLSTGAVLSEEPWDQLTLPPFVGFPPGINKGQQRHINATTVSK